MVEVKNGAELLDLDYSGTVSISLANNPGNDTLAGTLTAPVDQGMAIFPGLTLHNADPGYTIQATAAQAVVSDDEPVQRHRRGHGTGRDGPIPQAWGSTLRSA